MDIDIAAQQTGINNISVHGLDHEKHDDRDEKPFEILTDQTNNNGRAVGDDRSYVGDQIADTAQNTDNDCVTDPDQGQAAADKDRHDEGIDQLSADIS